jgi:hypothetical protein
MKRYLGAWLFLFYSLIIFPPDFALSAGAQDDLDHKLAAGKIDVIPEGVPGESLKCAKVIGVVDAPPEIVWQVITDVNDFKNFMPRTLNSMAVPEEKVLLIKQRGPNQTAEDVEQSLGAPVNLNSYRIPGGKYTGYLYSHLEFPWPCRNRWYIIKVSHDESRATQHIYQNSWSLEIGNLKENSGEWLLEPFGSSKTKATYRLCTDPGGYIPGFLVKQGTYHTMPDIIKAVREQAAKLRGTQP